MKDKWIRLTEQLPERNSNSILIYTNTGWVLLGMYGAFFKDTEPDFWLEDWQRLTNVYADNVKVTHWQPIEIPNE